MLASHFSFALAFQACVSLSFEVIENRHSCEIFGTNIQSLVHEIIEFFDLEERLEFTWCSIIRTLLDIWALGGDLQYPWSDRGIITRKSVINQQSSMCRLNSSIFSKSCGIVEKVGKFRMFFYFIGHLGIWAATSNVPDVPSSSLREMNLGIWAFGQWAVGSGQWSRLFLKLIHLIEEDESWAYGHLGIWTPGLLNNMQYHTMFIAFF